MAQRIKELRKELNMTLLEVAHKLGVSEGTVQRYESGNIKNLKYDTIVNLAEIFNCSPAYLMGWDDKDNAPVYDTAAGQGRITDGYPTDAYELHLKDDEFLHRVYGESMSPTIEDHDLVVINIQSVLDYDGQIALVKVNGEEATLKRVEIKNDGILLVGDNIRVFAPKFYSAEEVEQLPVRIEGVVVRIIRDVR